MATPQQVSIRIAKALEALTERVIALEQQVAALTALLAASGPAPTNGSSAQRAEPARKGKPDDQPDR